MYSLNLFSKFNQQEEGLIYGTHLSMVVLLIFHSCACLFCFVQVTSPLIDVLLYHIDVRICWDLFRSMSLLHWSSSAIVSCTLLLIFLQPVATSV